jgi:hypothetical protein
MFSAGFVPVIRAIKRLQTYAVDHTATESALLYLLTVYCELLYLWRRSGSKGPILDVYNDYDADCLLHTAVGSSPTTYCDELCGGWHFYFISGIFRFKSSLHRPYSLNSHRKINKMQQCIKILFHIYIKINIFQAKHRPSSGS